MQLDIVLTCLLVSIGAMVAYLADESLPFTPRLAEWLMRDIWATTRLSVPRHATLKVGVCHAEKVWHFRGSNSSRTYLQAGHCWSNWFAATFGSDSSGPPQAGSGV